jgi:7-cyano-7-deazaguanine synthase
VKKAVVLLSGGLDSAVALFYAIDRGYKCFALTFNYGQKNSEEVKRAKAIARRANVPIKAVRLKLPWKGSSLTDRALSIPVNRAIKKIISGVPSTYVPARNSMFLSIAASYAESIDAGAIFIGAHSDDSGGYPDCRIDFLKAFAKAIRFGTRAGIKGKISVKFPLIMKNKSGIIKQGISLGAPLELTRSCYKSGDRPCGECDSCILRAKGFREAGIKDPAITLIYE